MRAASNASAVVDARQPCADALGYLRPTGGPACPRRARPLVLVAGEGNTGTSTIAWALAQFGLVTAHWRDVLCPETMAGDECAERKSRHSAQAHAHTQCIHCDLCVVQCICTERTLAAQSWASCVTFHPP